MVDSFALVVSQSMMIYVLWRCFMLPPDDGRPEKPTQAAEPPVRRRYRRGKNDAGR